MILRENRNKTSKNGKIFNLPPGTLTIILIILFSYILTKLIPNNWLHFVILNLGFIPARYTFSANASWQLFISPISHIFLHIGFFHLIINLVMLSAFGSSIEKLLGIKSLIIIFILSGLLGILSHYLFYTHSLSPVI